MIGKLHLAKVGIICLVLALGLGTLGVSLGQWDDILYAKDIKIDTSGSEPIDPGETFGDFEVVGGENLQGKVTLLELKYNGNEPASIEVKAGKKVVFKAVVNPNETFSIYGTDKDGELGKEIKIKTKKPKGGGGGGNPAVGGNPGGGNNPGGGKKGNDKGEVKFVAPVCGGGLTSDPPADDGTIGELFPTAPPADGTYDMNLQPDGAYPYFNIYEQDKNVGATEVTHNVDEATVTIYNGYPCYLVWVSLYIKNSGNIPVTVSDIVVDPLPDVLYNAGLSTPAWVITGPPQCGECDGGVTWLKLQNNGPGGDITVKTKKDEEVLFEGYVASGGQFEVGNIGEKLGTEIKVYVDDVLKTAIHTSCSDPIGIGSIFGGFEVIDGASLNGGKFCPINGSTECSEVIVAGSSAVITNLTDFFPGLTEEKIISNLEDEIIDKMEDELKKVWVNPGGILDLHLLFHIEQWAEQNLTGDDAITFTVTPTFTQWTP